MGEELGSQEGTYPLLLAAGCEWVPWRHYAFAHIPANSHKDENTHTHTHTGVNWGLGTIKHTVNNSL